MTTQRWPDVLQPPDPARIAELLAHFWLHLQQLPDLLGRREYLLAEEHAGELRQLVIDLMLALNGIRRPVSTTHLNTYLSESQRAAIQKTLLLTEVSAESWIGRAVALVVIYRWYAPQLVAKFGLPYPHAAEAAALAHLQQSLPDWPLTITTD
jgi:hypothetical protein